MKYTLKRLILRTFIRFELQITASEFIILLKKLKYYFTLRFCCIAWKMDQFVFTKTHMAWIQQQHIEGDWTQQNQKISVSASTSRVHARKKIPTGTKSIGRCLLLLLCITWSFLCGFGPYVSLEVNGLRVKLM